MENFDEKFREIFGDAPVITLDPGNVVLCDGCNHEYTDSEVSGGILFGSYAYGPCCAPRMEEGAKKYNEEYNIKGRCPEGKSFADWVREDLR